LCELYSYCRCGKEVFIQKFLSTERQWGVWTTPEIRGYGLHNGFCDTNGMYEDENTIVLSLIILSYVKSMKT